jgi:hypothetical protein
MFVFGSLKCARHSDNSLSSKINIYRFRCMIQLSVTLNANVKASFTKYLPDEKVMMLQKPSERCRADPKERISIKLDVIGDITNVINDAKFYIVR